MDLTALVTILAENIEPLIAKLQLREKIAPLGLRRAERLPVLAAIQMALSRPILLISDRADHAMNLFDELALWSPHVSRLLFPEPNPLFYEKSPWGDNTRRDRLTALAALASYHIPGVDRQEKSPIIIAPARAVMTRTIPRREFLKATHNLKQGQKIQPVELKMLPLRESSAATFAKGGDRRRCLFCLLPYDISLSQIQPPMNVT